MRLIIEIDCDNAAFGDDDHSRGVEVSRLLHDAADRLYEDGVGEYTDLTISDGNGNRVLHARTTDQKVSDILIKLVDQIDGIGIADWYGAEGLDMSDARNTVAQLTRK